LDRDTVIKVVAENIDPNQKYRVLMRAQPDLLPLVEGRYPNSVFRDLLSVKTGRCRHHRD